MVLGPMLTSSLGDDASEKDLIFAMLMSTGDGSGNIKADWQKVERIMTSWGHSFTIGAMCKSSNLNAPNQLSNPFHVLLHKTPSGPARVAPALRQPGVAGACRDVHAGSRPNNTPTW